MMPYSHKPEPFFDLLHASGDEVAPRSRVYCAGFDRAQWRAKAFAAHLVEWLPDYALAEDELRFHHGNAYVKLQQAAVRVYTSPDYEHRGEAGEITLHAICREYFATIPIAPRIFYKSSSNDPVKSFDLVHARFPAPEIFEIWLGEAKFYTDGAQAVAAAIASIKSHIEQGFLTREKLLLGPQISRSIPQYDAIMRVFRSQTRIDDFINASVFVVGIVSESPAAAAAKVKCNAYVAAALAELEALLARLHSADFGTKLSLSSSTSPWRARLKSLASLTVGSRGYNDPFDHSLGRT